MRLLAFALAVTAASSAHARSSDREQAMDITADYQKTQLNTNNNQPGATHLKGNVRMVQGTMKVHGDEATMYQHPNNAKDAQGNDLSGGVQRVVIIGKPAHLEEQQDNNAGLVSADAEKIDYNADTGIAELTGDVKVVQQGRGEFHGAHMTYNTNTGEMESGDYTPAGRIHIITQPKPKSKPAKDAPAKADAKAAGTDGSL
ncbi:lipopolysaccharide transport periplasmic protein LptA [Dokdonella soli]|uniref:Lipopolysaccharide transport periplasmic protein LptA n=1 Tax=Dokdonella soli TaxID=529810 RepID=A0ABN1II21_9GAMM